jgi:hypothetical protein
MKNLNHGNGSLCTHFSGRITDMFELRWLEKETGRQLQNEWGYFYMEIVKILQYRYIKPITEYRENNALTINKWSEWIDVPTYIESTGAIK